MKENKKVTYNGEVYNIISKKSDEDRTALIAVKEGSFDQILREIIKESRDFSEDAVFNVYKDKLLFAAKKEIEKDLPHWKETWRTADHPQIIDGKLIVADSYIDIESLKKLPGYLFL